MFRRQAPIIFLLTKEMNANPKWYAVILVVPIQKSE